MLNETGWVLGGESSGHIICRGFTTTGDGIVAALQILSILSQQAGSLSALAGQLQKCPQVLINVKLNGSSGDPLNNAQVLESVTAAETALEGSGRVLLRKSGTEPLVRVMVEGIDGALVQSLAENIAGVVENEVG